MTDLERAHQLRQSLEAAIHPEMRDCFEQCVMHLLAAARREGAAEMRERAAQEVEWKTDDPYIATAIRALPLTPEEPPTTDSTPDPPPEAKARPE